MDSQSGREPQEAERAVSRRAFVRGGTGLAAAALAPTFAGGAAAQITTNAALPTSASTLSGDDYVGMFVEVLNGPLDVESPDIRSCDFVESGDTIDGYDVRLIDETDRSRTAESRLYATQDNENVRAGQTFVVNQQSECSQDFVSLNLEQREAAGQVTGDDEDEAGGGGGDVATPGPGAGETATPGVDTEGEQSPGEVDTPTPNGTAGTAGETPGGAGTEGEGQAGGGGAEGGDEAAQTTAADPATGAETPGFGVVAALSGLAAAAAAAARRSES